MPLSYSERGLWLARHVYNATVIFAFGNDVLFYPVSKSGIIKQKETGMAHDRRKISDVLFSALQCAKQDRQSFIEAYGCNKSEPAVRDAMADIRAFESLQKRLFGTTRSELDRITDNMRPINLYRLREIMDANPDLFDWAND